MTAFLPRLDQPARFTGPLPAACDVAVIGGGIIGVMTAWYLARAGQRVVLCEKGRVAGEQSSRNWGWIRQQGRDPAELPIMIEALAIWKELEDRAASDLGFRQAGVLYLSGSEAETAEHEAWMLVGRAHGVDTRMLTADEVAAMLPHKVGWRGGLFTPSDARAEPWVAVPAFAAAAARDGVSLHEMCAVRALDVSAGRIAGVVTEQGRVACDRVVLAGGAWSSLLARAHGVTFPQLSVRSTVAATVPLPEIAQCAAADRAFAFRRRLDGGYSIAAGTGHDVYLGPDAFRHVLPFIPQLRRDARSTRFHAAAPRHYPDAWGTPRRWDAGGPSPFEAMRILNPAPNMDYVRRAQDGFGRAFPQIGRPPIVLAWAGMIDVMPDTVPVIDHAAALPGLTIATGMCGHGFGIGPGVGRVVADMVMGRDPGHDLTRFRLSRFADGSKIDLGPSL
jgi:glycine/D-amino acid oxidase-like deaminating enzyme